MMVATLPRSRNLYNTAVSTLCCASDDESDCISEIVTRKVDAGGIKASTYPLPSWALHQTTGADHYTPATGHHASVDLRLWVRAPDPTGHSGLAAWPQHENIRRETGYRKKGRIEIEIK